MIQLLQYLLTRGMQMMKPEMGSIGKTFLVLLTSSKFDTGAALAFIKRKYHRIVSSHEILNASQSHESFSSHLLEFN